MWIFPRTLEQPKQNKMDSITEQRINLLHPSIREEVRRLVNECNNALTKHSQMRITQGLRTFAEQDALYAQSRTKPGPKVTNAKGGQSYHNYGLAIDFCLILDGKEVSWDTTKDFDQDGMADWIEVARIFQREGYKWGKAFNDLPHFEKSKLHWRELLKMYDQGKTFTERINGIVYKYVKLN
jgi:peptidoglycan L-alanyl-D-glutamate endopeptidase CwlK